MEPSSSFRIPQDWKRSSGSVE